MRAFAIWMLLVSAPSAVEAGDAIKGEALFRNCLACHSITSTAGEKIRVGGRVGPNLFGVTSRPAGSYPGYTYSPGLTKLGGSGFVWTEADVAEFVTNPNQFLETKLGAGTISKMPFALPDGAADVAAYLAAVATR